MAEEHCKPGFMIVNRSYSRTLCAALMGTMLLGWPWPSLAEAKEKCPDGHSRACTDEEIVNTLTYDAGLACSKDEWDLCASLATRALSIDPSAITASTLVEMAMRRDAKVTPVRTSPGFMNGLIQLSVGIGIGGLNAQPKQVLSEIQVGRRFGKIGGRGVFQLDGGLILGSYSPYEVKRAERTDTNFNGIVDDDDDNGKIESEGFLARRFGAGSGVRFTIGFAVKTTRFSAIEFVWVPGLRFVTSGSIRDLTWYADFGTGLAFQYGRLRSEVLARVSTGSILGAGELSPAIWGIVMRGSIAVGQKAAGKGKKT